MPQKDPKKKKKETDVKSPAERDKLNKEVDDLRKETPKSFRRKDLDALEGQLDVWLKN